MSTDEERGQSARHGSAGMVTRMNVEGIDLALLKQAGRILGADDRSTVDQALAELIRDRNQRRAVTAEIRRYESGQFASLVAARGVI